MVSLLIRWLIVATVVFLVSKLLPGVRLKSYATALVVAVVYGIINTVAYWILTVLTLGLFPLVGILTFGVAFWLVNSAALWATDQMVEDFEVDGLGTTLFAALLISLGSLIGQRLIIALA